MPRAQDAQERRDVQGRSNAEAQNAQEPRDSVLAEWAASSNC
jgi:hypothetical protein